MSSAKRILITGITGFMGSHFADYLLSLDEDFMIYGFQPRRSSVDNIRHLLNDRRVELIGGDLSGFGTLLKLIYDTKPDYVFHFAAQSSPSKSFNTPIETLMTNVIGTTKLFDALRSMKKQGICDPIIIPVSTSEVYGKVEQSETPITEKNEIRAANPYAISKVAHDSIAQWYHKAHGLKIIITRMFSHEGERRSKDTTLSRFAWQIVQHEVSKEKSPYKIKVGNLDAIRTYCHVSDACRAYWVAATKGKIGEVYNIGGTDTRTVGEALNDLMVRSSIPVEDFELVNDPTLIKPTDTTFQIADCSKFTKHTGWVAKTGLNEVNESLLKYWRSKSC